MPEQTRSTIIQDLLEFSNQQPSFKTAPAFSAFLEQYYSHAPLRDLEKRTLRDLYGAALSHYELMRVRTTGQYKRHIFNPTLEQDGWESQYTIVQCILHDQPFLVDSLCSEIHRLGLAVQFVVHLGGIRIARNDHHEITDILPPLLDKMAECQTYHVEAPIHIEIDKQTDLEILNNLAVNLDRVIADARLVVEDWPEMRDQVDALLKEYEYIPNVPETELKESRLFLQWLLENHFTFLGVRRYDCIGEGSEKALRLVQDSGLGVLKDTQRSKQIRYYADLPLEVQKMLSSNALILLAKTNTRATVHGNRYTDFISVKRFDGQGNVVGESWFVGLYTGTVYHNDPIEFPLVRQKIMDIMKRSELPHNGHAFKALIHILKTLPRDDLFHAPTDELFHLSQGIFEMQDRRCIRLFVHKDGYNRFVSCLIYVPVDDFNVALCYKMELILKEAFDALEVSYSTSFSDSVLARIHFIVRIDSKKTHVYNVEEIEQKLVAVGTSWKESLKEHLVSAFGEEKGNRLLLRYQTAFPASYKENFLPETAVKDIQLLEELNASGAELEMRLYRPKGAPADAIRFKLYHPLTTVPLSDAIPILERMGLRVIGEQPYKITPASSTDCQTAMWINDFNMRHVKGMPLSIEEIGSIFQEAFAAVWEQRAEHDGFNSLVLSAKLPYREVALLRAYAKYLKQIGIRFNQDYIEQALYNNPNVVVLLVQLFMSQFSVQKTEETRQSITDRIKEILNTVTNLDEDRILRMFLNLIRSTVRTNYFQTTPQGLPKPYLSIKFNPVKIPYLPLPKPLHEIFVYAPHMEGVHLRANDVARGGIRWSDRKEDFRREVLGLMKAQQVKNAVIVPAGAKGGFVLKLLPADADRDAAQKEGIRCYQDFIRGLLDLTDNVKEGVNVHPENTVCRDGDDTYLVVAADKGTASFSDIANQISKDYGFWLHDAFASGGSAGYDHKKIGITARGAFESVKQHFQFIGIDPVQTPFTVIGIGDMAGDVFGNGMLLSDKIKLIAAFNGLRIFLDPNPDPATSFVERQRLFNLPRSTWQDYNPTLISQGGGIYLRSLKSIPISPEIQAILGIDKNSLTPNDLIKAILRAPVDLLWNGGIGTFVKSKEESDADVGDRSSDDIRVEGYTLRCKVVGEGGNLGFTQLGRIEYALQGGRINTDFIDNSGGVDCSDHEVNLKILLNHLLVKQEITEEKRDQLLAEMQDQVAELVLQNNHKQAAAVSFATAHSTSYLNLYQRYLTAAVKEGRIDRELEFLPTDEIFAARRALGKGLTAPEIAVLMAYSKIMLKADILKSDLTDDTYLHAYLMDAFPALVDNPRYTEALTEHKLRREIIATQLSNKLITTMGITFVYQMQDETRASVPDIVKAYLIASEVLNSRELAQKLESTEIISLDLETQMTSELVRLMRRSIRWLLHNNYAAFPIQETITIFTKGMQELTGYWDQVISDSEKEEIEEKITHWVWSGALPEIAKEAAAFGLMFSVWNIIRIAHSMRADIQVIARLYFGLSVELDLAVFRKRINDCPVETHWMSLARSAAKSDLDQQQRELVRSIYQFNKQNGFELDQITAWFEKNKVLIERWKQRFNDMKASQTLEYAMLVVVLRELSDLVQAANFVIEQQ